MSFFINGFQEDIWNDNYRFGDETIEGTFRRVASTIASIESEPFRTMFENKLHDALINRRITFGGRIVSNLGTGRKAVNAFNCYAGQRSVKPVDSIENIYSDLTNMSQILKTEGGAGQDFCLRFDTPILIRRNGTDEMWCVLNDVMENDEVLSDDGMWHKVEAILSSTKKDMVSFTLENGEDIHATIDHPFLVERNNERVWVEAKDILKTDTLISL